MFNCPQCNNKIHSLTINSRSQQKRDYYLCDCGWTNCPNRYIQQLKELKENITVVSSPEALLRFKERILAKNTKKAEPAEQSESIKEE